ncbi:hypothetical protein ACFXKF_32915 [Streptomyces scopuliridis]|uniref:hypothetical protein n=1 Tax=Streptomyces scopuliridis TaxID=452529 RepID=UPI0036B847B1
MHAWNPVSRDDTRVPTIRQTFTVCRRRDTTPAGHAWSEVEALEAWAMYDDLARQGHISLASDWDRVQIASQFDDGVFYELARPPVKVLVLSAWIVEDGTVVESPETTRDAAWTESFDGDWDRHATRAAQWIASVPQPGDPFDYAYSHRFQEAMDRVTVRLKKWAYERLETSGVSMCWHIEDHRIHLRDGLYRTRVLLTGSDFETVREEWIGGLPRTRRQLIADDRFRRAVNERGNVVDLGKIKAGPSLLEKLRRELARAAVPQPRTAPFRTPSWVAWTCPDTGTERRGVVVEESLSRSKVVAVRILPDDGGGEVDAHVAGGMGKLKNCGKIREGEPGTVIPVPAPVAG